jgi:putative peptidoglycan lipid II flippase
MTRSKALSNRQIARATLVVITGFLASGLLGLIRTAVISATFGASDALDAFYAAQRIPETIFVLVAGGALGSSFIPVFSRFLAADDPDSAWRLASATMTLVGLASSALALVVALLSPFAIPALLVPGSPPEMQALTVSLTQIMLVTPVVFSVSGIVTGILNAHQSFLLPALAPSMYNIGLIIGALVLARILPEPPPPIAFHLSWDNTLDRLVPHANIYGLAWGAILGSCLHLAVQLPSLHRLARVRYLPSWRVPGVREVFLLMGPRILGLAVVQINFAVNVAFSSTMVAGSLTALNTAWFLLFFVLGVIGRSIGAAVFPSLSALTAEADMDGFKNRLSSAMRGTLFLSFPATVGLILLGKPVISLLFERGEWTPESTAGTAWALSFFAIGIAGHSLLEVLSRAFYAMSDTRTPVAVGIVSMLSNIVLSIIFIRLIGDPTSLSRGPFAGLALSNSLTTIGEALVLWWLLRRRVGGVNDARVLDAVWRGLVASSGMGLVLLLALNFLNNSGALLTVVIGGLVGVTIFFGLSLALGVEEARAVPRMVLQGIRR